MRRPIEFAIACALTLVVGEIAVSAAASRLPEPLRYMSPTVQSVVHDMEALQHAGVRSELVFVGTSMVRRDIDANTMERELGWSKTSVHNVALPGAQTNLVKRWLLDEVVSRLHPKRVVWGISSLDFNANRPDAPINFYNSARATKPGVAGDLDRAIEHLAISEHRDALRNPGNLSGMLSGSAVRYNTIRPLPNRATWKLSYPKISAKALTNLRRDHAKTIREKQLRNYVTGSQEWSAFIETVAALRAKHIEVAIVIMPVTTGYLGFHPHGPAQYLQWKNKVLDAMRSQQITTFDLSRSMPDASFRDYEHLWVDAAMHDFTPKLAHLLRQVGWARPA